MKRISEGVWLLIFVVAWGVLLLVYFAQFLK
jgi:hypothetical protein